MIAREGIPFIAVGLGLTAAMILAGQLLNNNTIALLGVIPAIFSLFCIYFFRDPHRVCSDQPDLLIAPGDGRIVAINEVKAHEFVGDAICISTFLSVFDVHINRVPTAGTVKEVLYNPGKFFAAYKDKASLLNEQTEIRIVSGTGQKIAFKQIAGLIARRIVCTLKTGDVVSAGQRCGLIRFGSRVDLIVPIGSSINVKIGDRVKGGQSVLAKLLDTSSSESPRPEENSNHVKL